MLENGLLDEAKEFYKEYASKTAVNAIGYKELKPYFDGFKTLEEFDEYAKEYAVEIIKADLVVSAIIQAEGLEITDEEYELFLAELIEVTGKTREEVITQYGGEDSIKETLLFDEVDKLVVKENNYVVAE
jgi:FKBP-type peptidyl-prolyl cis-trans isomerase (trigger factor)